MTSPDIHSGSPERFGYEWSEYSEILPIHREQFDRWTAPLSPDDWAGCEFLDVGCGMGRNSYWPLSYGARQGTAIDVDERSLESARRTLAKYPNAQVRKLSAYDIDYRDQFDIVFSIGVIHHLEFPDRAIQKMVSATRPGGRVLIWVYGRENNEWIVRFVDPIRKRVLSRLPIGLLHHLSLLPAFLLWVRLKAWKTRSPYLKLLATMSFRQVRSIVFDQLLPRIANYWSRAEVEALLARANLTDIKLLWVNEMSWTAVGRKPII